MPARPTDRTDLSSAGREAKPSITQDDAIVISRVRSMQEETLGPSRGHCVKLQADISIGNISGAR